MHFGSIQIFKVKIYLLICFEKANKYVNLETNLMIIWICTSEIFKKRFKAGFSENYNNFKLCR